MKAQMEPKTEAEMETEMGDQMETGRWKLKWLPLMLWDGPSSHGELEDGSLNGCRGCCGRVHLHMASLMGKDC